MKFAGEFGLKFAIQTATQYKLPDLLRFAQLAHAEGFQQIWVNDNLSQRNIFVVLSAIAARIPVKIGTSIVVPYFRNPVDVAGSLTALSELTDGRELSVGIARGEKERAGQQIEMIKPIAMVRETTLALKALLASETIRFRDYPNVCAYHHILPDKEFRLGFAPAAPVRFYGGGHGRKILQFAGEAMDGIYFGDHFIPMARAGRLAALLPIPRSAAQNRAKSLFDICELDIAVARDRRRALDFAKPFAGHILLQLEAVGFTAEDFRAIGIAPPLVKSLGQALRRGAIIHEATNLLTDEDVRSCFIAGTAEECRDQLAAVVDQAERLGFGQIAFAKFGPDWDEAIKLLRGIAAF